MSLMRAFRLEDTSGLVCINKFKLAKCKNIEPIPQSKFSSF